MASPTAFSNKQKIRVSLSAVLFIDIFVVAPVVITEQLKMYNVYV